ncbi:activator of 90 kDa heat shock protein ATPase homolog 2-like [Stegodyphus dumicola]|uniref:activator of 90 kDa heat shock protein ATPase homolog 2-like n=1 Tax=Stegodyphus dumicola TaxID=202533 RepID=UPI0015AD5D9B|nr:activator of 90 kDa heat shock protein ATPase homolog 2-like [Stegodyphus dumicola]
MSKWNKSDPRWLVEERPDAKNVNNWHWSEKDASQWSKQKFDELFIGTKIETNSACCEITEITQCDGEAIVNNRKGKLIFFYEWALEMQWSGVLINANTKASGTIEVPNFSEEHEIKIVDVNVYSSSVGPEGEILKNIMKTTGTEIVRQKLEKYLTSLKNEFPKGLILPTKDPSDNKIIKSDIINRKNDFRLLITESPEKQTFETNELKTVESFKCTADEFYSAMTVKELVEVFTRDNCILEPKEGGRFELFNGNVHGYFVKLVPGKTIQQKWRLKTWPHAHFSDVCIDIEQKTDCTEVSVAHLGIPKTELENIREGWKRFYWDSIKRTFGFGAFLL